MKGLDSFVRTMNAAQGERLVRNINRALFVTADAIKATAQQSITAGSVSGKNHVPSMPGEPPNADTRTLDKNIEATQTRPLTAEVSSNAPYAAFLELGTSNMGARPYFAPARDAHRDDLVKNVAAAINHTMKDATR